MTTVLIVDDEPNIRNTLATTFRLEDYRVETAEHGDRALDRLEEGGVDLVILDLEMPVRDGMDTLREMRRRRYDVPVVILTAHGSIERAVESVRLGAFDLVEKPPHGEKILLAARNALRQTALEEENRELRETAGVGRDMIGKSPPMQRLRERIARVAPTQARVLVLGENGTGKELVARALHEASNRASKPFVSVNCAAVPRELFESELFGHERGAFTGATSRRRGKFARADGGTLLLDEVGEIPTSLQSKILRTLETGVIEPVGSEREAAVDVRVIAATNRDLEAEIAAGRFREDLYYRLKVVTLTVPPLRDRLEDLEALARHFLLDASRKNNLRSPRITEAALERLAGHDWPGNVRELRNLMERMVILSAGDVLDVADVEDALPSRGTREAPVSSRGRPLRDTMADLERKVVLEALERTGWHMTATARELGLERSHLYKKLRALDISRPER